MSQDALEPQLYGDFKGDAIFLEIRRRSITKIRIEIMIEVIIEIKSAIHYQFGDHT
jgi:hypothetical protein